MKTLYSSAIAIFLLVGITTKSFGQCGPIFQDFNTSANGIAGFTGAGAGATFGLVSNALKFSNVNSTNGNYTVTTPVLRLPANATTIDYGFILSLGSQASISGVTVTIKYVSSADVVTTTAAQSISGALSSGSATTFCSTLAKPGIITTGVSANSYQLIFTFTATGNGNNPAFITVDEYRTSSTLSLIVLSVRFSSFTIKAAGSGANLSWNVQEEENVKIYEIQRGTDGKNFSKIGAVASSVTKSYGYNDERTLEGISYYRIKSFDADNHAVYSTVISWKNGKSSIVFKGFPTLTSGKVTIQHDVATSVSSIAVSSTDGRVIKTIVPAAGTQQTILDLSSAQPGIYFLRYNNGNGVAETLKIIKQ